MAKTAAARGPPSTETMGARGPKSPNRPDQKSQACLILEPTSSSMMTGSRRGVVVDIVVDIVVIFFVAKTPILGALGNCPI
jgi:hypothetical protein